MMMCESLREFFSYLEANEVRYLVLRNYEDFERDDFLMPGHADIDLLCSDRRRLRELVGADTKSSPERAVRFRVMISGCEVPVDARETGDGYYCRKWEEDMLAKRRMYNSLCWVMDDETYFYSLIYHVLIHKHSVSDEYLARLKAMGRNPSINADVREDNLVAILEAYMSSHGYTYTYPLNPGGIMNLKHKGLTRSMVESSPSIHIKRAVFRVKRVVKRILRSMKG